MWKIVWCRISSCTADTWRWVQSSVVLLNLLENYCRYLEWYLSQRTSSVDDSATVTAVASCLPPCLPYQSSAQSHSYRPRCKISQNSVSVPATNWERSSHFAWVRSKWTTLRLFDCFDVNSKFSIWYYSVAWRCWCRPNYSLISAQTLLFATMKKGAKL